MNWRLFALGLIIAMASHFSGAYIGHKFTLATNQSNLEQMKPTLDKAIEKATNQITNEIKIDKVKKSDSLTLVMEPSNSQRSLTLYGTDSICFEISKLTNRQKRVLNLR